MRCLFEAARCTAKLPASLGDMDILTLLDTIKNGKFALLGCSGPPLPLQRNGIAMPSRPELPRCGDGGGGGGGGDGIRTRPPPPLEVDEEEVQAQPLALTMHNKPAAPSSAPVPMVTSPTGGGLPASPGKRKFTRPQADGVSQQGSVESEDEEDPATKASRLMPLNLSKSASVDYIREREKARGHSPLVRSASLPPRHLPGAAAYRYAGTSSSPALAVSPNPGPSSPGEAARSGAPFLRAGTLPAFLLQQMRPSVITCAPGASTHRSNGRHVSRPISVSNGLSVSHRREPSASMSSDPVVEEHFRRSLGRDYRDPAATVTAATAAGAASCRPGDPTPASNRVSVTGSVDDHFMRALGDTWLRLRSPGSGSSGDDRSPHPASPPFPFSPPLTPSAVAAAAAASSPPPPPLLLLPPPAVRSESGVRAYGGQTAAVSVSPHRSSHRAPSPRVLL